MPPADPEPRAGRRVLLLDVMGTLVHEPFYEEVTSFFGMSLDALLRAKHPTTWQEFERGEIDEAELYRRFFRDGRTFDGPALKRCMADAYRFLDGMEEVLRELSAAGFEMHALSNYPDWYRLIDERLGLSRFLEWSFVSCRTGHRKPDPEAYLVALRALDLSPSAATFVDDRETNCRAARELGIDSVLFTGAEALRADLRTRGFLRW